MKKINFTFLFAVLMSMVSAKAFAHDIEVKNADGVTIYYNFNNTELAVSYRGNWRDDYSDEYTGNVVIPESVTYNGNTYYVTSIDNFAFSWCSGLTEVTIPSSVTTIGGDAFYGCSSLTEVTIPSSVTSIGNDAFSGCSSLAEVIIEDGTNKLDIIGGYYSFANCPIKKLYLGRDIDNFTIFGASITSLTIGNSVTSIGMASFYGCSGLTELTIPNSVKSIGSEAFSGCSGLTKVIIPSSVVTIGGNAFYGCSGLEKVIVKDLAAWCGISFIGSSANPLYYAHHLYIDEDTEVKDLVIPNNVTSIGSYAFSGCSGLTKLTISNSVTSIDSYAFSGCSGLTELTIPSSVTTIADRTFYGCSGLAEVTIPSSVTTIFKRAFEGCSKYKMTSYATIPPTMSDVELSFFHGKAFDATSLEVPFQTTALYARSDCWKDIDKIYAVKDGIVYCPVLVEQEGGKLVSVNGESNDIEVAENSTVEVRAIAKVERSDLVLLNINDRTDELVNNGSFSFIASTSHKKNIVKTAAYTQTTATVSTSGTLLDIVGMANVGNIQCLKVTGDLNGTDLLAIRKMTNLRHLDIGEANIVNGGLSYHENYVTSKDEIGAYFFYGMENLQKVVMPKSVTAIRDHAFEDCNRLLSATIPNNVKIIGSNAFGNCSDLSVVTIPDNVTSIGSYAFDGCKGLLELTIGNNVTTIGYRAFRKCGGLTELTLPSSVTSIEDEAFYSCSSITSVISFNPIPPAINKNTFDTFTEQTATLHVPSGCKTVYWLNPYWENFATILEDASTGIGTVLADKQKQSNAIYTIGGVKCHTTRLSDLPKGIYIVNGQKVVVK